MKLWGVRFPIVLSLATTRLNSHVPSDCEAMATMGFVKRLSISLSSTFFLSWIPPGLVLHKDAITVERGCPIEVRGMETEGTLSPDTKGLTFVDSITSSNIPSLKKPERHALCETLMVPN